MPAGLVRSVVLVLMLTLVRRQEYVVRRLQVEVEVEDNHSIVEITLVPPDIPAVARAAAR